MVFFLAFIHRRDILTLAWHSKAYLSFYLQPLYEFLERSRE